MTNRVGSALCAIKARLDDHLPAATILKTAKKLGQRWRNRLLKPITTIHLFLPRIMVAVMPVSI